MTELEFVIAPSPFTSLERSPLTFPQLGNATELVNCGAIATCPKLGQLTTEDEWEPWDFLAAAFSIARLRQMLA